MTGYAPVAVAVELRSVGVNAREFELLKSSTPVRPQVVSKAVPVPGVEVEVSQPGGKATTGKTGTAGDLKMTGLVPVSYTVKVSAVGYEPASTRVTVAKEIVRREVVLARVKTAKK